MKRTDLLYKLTGTEEPMFITEREDCIINKCLELINERESINSENLLSINDLLSALEQTTKYLKLMSESKNVRNLDECLSNAEIVINKNK
jgi:hypothetical protein